MKYTFLFVPIFFIVSLVEWITGGSIRDGIITEIFIATFAVIIEFILVKKNKEVEKISKKYSKQLFVIGMLLVVGPGFLMSNNLIFIILMMTGILFIILSVSDKD